MNAIRYEVGTHVLEVTGGSGKWKAVVDGVALERWFLSSAEAWTAGVTEALRLDDGKSFVFVGAAEAGRPV